MKKFLFIFLFGAAIATGQTTEKEVDMSIKYYDKIQVIKQNNLFNFIGKPLKMVEYYDCNGNIDFVRVKEKEYVITFNSDTDVNINHQAGNASYYITVVGNDILGHGFLVDKALNRILTYYFQLDKVVEESVIKNRK